MKIVFAVSVVILITLACFLKTPITLDSFDEMPVAKNPLRGVQATLIKVSQQPLDFSLLDTPYSQDNIDTEIAGLIRVDDNNNLIIDGELKAFLDYFLSSVGQVTPEQALQRMRLHFFQQLPETAAAQAMEVLNNYLTFKEHSFDALAESIDAHRSEYDAQYRLEKLQQGLQTLYDLRRTHMGDDVASALFFEDEAYAQYTIINMQADLNDDISHAQRQQIKDLAKAQLPEEMASIIREQEKQAQAMYAYNKQLAQEPSIEAMRQFAFDNFDSEQAHAIAKDYEAQVLLKDKYQQFSQAIDHLHNQELDTTNEQDAIRDLASQYFTNEEYSMVQAWQLAQQR
jgi:lipase chaperone LimK